MSPALAPDAAAAAAAAPAAAAAAADAPTRIAIHITYKMTQKYLHLADQTNIQHTAKCTTMCLSTIQLIQSWWGERTI